MSYPVIRLRPKADARRIRHGHPWVYGTDIVSDRRTKALAPGALAVLEDSAREALGLVALSPASRIMARMLDRDPAAQIDGDWIKDKLTRALTLREALFDAPYYRLVHAEADGLPGVVIDRFADLAVIQPNAAWADRRAEEFAQALCEVVGVTTVILNGSGRARALEGLEDERRVLIGTAPEAPLQVPMNGAVYLADVMEGQKTGLFFDQRPNHAFAAAFAKEARVLDVFSHVGGFGLAALASGAAHVLAVDGSAPALTLAQGGAAAMGAEARFETRQGDAFKTLEALAAEGARFDVVICDPPAFAPAKSALEAGLRAYERVARLAAPLVNAGGLLGLCSCSHAAELGKFRNASIRGIGKALDGSGRQAQLIQTGFAGPDHPQHVALAESAYLKSLFFRL